MKDGATARSNEWCFTWNNPNKSLVEKRHYEKFGNSAAWWIMQYEKGENGTLHLQGCIKFKKEYSTMILDKIFPGAHWVQKESAEQADYCDKLETLEGEQFRFGQVPLTYRGQGIISRDNLYKWQRELEQELLQPVDPRKIYWIVGEDGNEGKTAFVKYMNWYHSYQFITGGKTADIGEAVKDWLSSAKGIIVDIPRNAPVEEYNYDSMEMFKNGNLGLT